MSVFGAISRVAAASAIWLAALACGSPTDPGCPRNTACDDYDLTGHHALVVRMQVRYTVGAPVVGANLRVVIEPPAGARPSAITLEATTNDVGQADGYVSFYGLVAGQAMIKVVVEPQPPFDLPAVTAMDSVRVTTTRKQGEQWYRSIVVLYPPHPIPTP